MEEEKKATPKKSVDYAALARSLSASRNKIQTDSAPTTPKASVNSKQVGLFSVQKLMGSSLLPTKTTRFSEPAPSLAGLGQSLGLQHLIKGYIKSASFMDNLMDRKGDTTKASKIQEVVKNKIMKADVARQVDMAPAENMNSANHLAVNESGIAVLCGKDKSDKFISNYIDYGLILETVTNEGEVTCVTSQGNRLFIAERISSDVRDETTGQPITTSKITLQYIESGQSPDPTPYVLKHPHRRGVAKMAATENILVTYGLDGYMKVWDLSMFSETREFVQIAEVDLAPYARDDCIVFVAENIVGLSRGQQMFVWKIMGPDLEVCLTPGKQPEGVPIVATIDEKWAFALLKVFKFEVLVSQVEAYGKSAIIRFGNMKIEHLNLENFALSKISSLKYNVDLMAVNQRYLITRQAGTDLISVHLVAKLEKEAEFTFPKCGLMATNKTGAFLLDTRTISIVRYCLLPGPRYYHSEHTLSPDFDM